MTTIEFVKAMQMYVTPKKTLVGSTFYYAYENHKHSLTSGNVILGTVAIFDVNEKVWQPWCHLAFAILFFY